MTDSDELRRLRFRVLKAVYDEAGASPTECVQSVNIAKRLEIGANIVMTVLRYFQGKELVEIVPYRPMGVSFYLIKITTKGIDEVETTLSGEESPTEHFKPNIVIVGSNVVNSPIQQASSNSTNVFAGASDSRIIELRELIEKIKELLNESSLRHEQKNDLQAEIQTIQGQLSSTKPKTKIITESITSVKTILEGVSPTLAAAAPIITKINMWLHGIS